MTGLHRSIITRHPADPPHPIELRERWAERMREHEARAEIPPVQSARLDMARWIAMKREAGVTRRRNAELARCVASIASDPQSRVQWESKGRMPARGK